MSQVQSLYDAIKVSSGEERRVQLNRLKLDLETSSPSTETLLLGLSQSSSDVRQLVLGAIDASSHASITPKVLLTPIIDIIRQGLRAQSNSLSAIRLASSALKALSKLFKGTEEENLPCSLTALDMQSLIEVILATMAWGLMPTSGKPGMKPQSNTRQWRGGPGSAFAFDRRDSQSSNWRGIKETSTLSQAIGRKGSSASLNSVHSEASTSATSYATGFETDHSDASDGEELDDGEIQFRKLRESRRGVRYRSISCIATMNEKCTRLLLIHWPRLLLDAENSVKAASLMDIVERDDSLSNRIASVHAVQAIINLGAQAGFMAGAEEGSRLKAFTSLSSRMASMIVDLRRRLLALMVDDKIPPSLLEAVLKCTRNLVVSTPLVKLRVSHSHVLRESTLQLCSRPEASTAVPAYGLLSVLVASDKESGKDDSSIKSTESSKAGPNKGKPLQGVPSGSFPASSIAKKNKKKREQLLKQAKGKEKASEDGDDSTTKGVTVAEGSDIIAHDLSDQQFGAMDESGRSYAEREYLVLSTAGKPIFISHVSKARLKRAAETKARRQQRQQEGGTDAKDEEEERLLAAEDSALQDEEDQNAATRVGVIQALISNYESLGLKELQHKSKEILELPKNSRISFLLKPPLYLAATSQWGEDEITLCNHLEYLYYAIISIVSASKLNRLFDRAANFDLKRLLDGTDGILDCLLTGLQVEAAPLYDSLRPLRIEAALRAETAAALVPSKDTVRPQDALYALLVGPSGVVALAKRKRKSIHPVDCHLLINTVYATKSMKEAGTQSWVPICLPKFAPQGFLYAHVSFLREREDQRNAEGADKEGALNENGQQTGKFTSELALVLVTSNPDGFDELSIWQNSIEETLYTQGILKRLKKAMLISNATYTVGELRLPGLRHFIFKWRSNLQSTSPQFEDPYEMNSDDQKRLICLYGIAQEYVYRRATSSSAIIPPPENAEQKPKDEEQKQEQQQGDSDKVLVASPPSPIIRPKNILAPSSVMDSKAKTKKINAPVLPLAPKRKPIITGQHLLKTSSEIVFAWSTSQFELYLAVGLHLPRNAIINIAKAIVKWVKQEEHRLFIASPSIFD